MKILIFLLTGLGAAQAQNVLQGRVVDTATQQVIPGAMIYIHDLKKGGVTDSAGFYRIDKLPRGKFMVESKILGYASQVIAADINGSTTLNFLVSPVAVELEEIVVTGISHTTELKHNPAAVSTIDADVLVRSASTNIIDNISRKAGLSQISTGMAISKPVIRGLGFNRIITLYDGIRQEGQQWGDEHGIEMDEFSVDRVEVIKGPGSLMYGSDGIGGVLHLLPAEPPTEGSITAQATANYQTNNGLFGGSIVTDGNINGWNWSARGSGKISSAYKNRYDGKVFNSGFNEVDWSARMGKSGSWGFTHFSVNEFNQHIGLPEGTRDADGNFTREVAENGNVTERPVTEDELTSYDLFIPNQQISHFKIVNSSNLYFGESRFQISAGYQHNLRKEFANPLDEEEPELFFDLNTVTYNLIYFLPEKKGWGISIGTGGMNQNNKNKGEEFLIPEYMLTDWGAFFFLKKQLERLSLAGGFRYDIRDLSTEALYLDSNGEPTSDDTATQKFAQADLFYSDYSASAGLTYEFSPAVNMKFNLSRGFRSPNISEIASNGQHEGSFRYEYGNYNLKRETSFQGDLSLSVNNEHISAEVSVFRNSIQNYIYAEKLLASSGGDSIPDPSDPSPAYQYVQGKAVLAGGELSIDIHPHPLDWLHFEQSFSIVSATNMSSGTDADSKYLPFIPAPRYLGEVSGSFAKLGGVLQNFYVKTEFDYSWKQNRVLAENGAESPTPSYGLWNVGAGGRVNSASGEMFSFYLSVNNLFDNTYQSHLSRLKYGPINPATGRDGIYNMGRNLSVKIVVPIVFRRAAR